MFLRTLFNHPFIYVFVNSICSSLQAIRTNRSGETSVKIYIMFYATQHNNVAVIIVRSVFLLHQNAWNTTSTVLVKEEAIKSQILSGY